MSARELRALDPSLVYIYCRQGNTGSRHKRVCSSAVQSLFSFLCPLLLVILFWGHRMGGWWQLGEVMVAGGLSSELAEDIEHLGFIFR